MKNNTFSDTIIPFVSKTALFLASGLFLVSCGIQSGYTETDGIYYDPATDKIERKIAWQEPDYYDMDERAGFEEDNNQTGIIGQSQKNQQLQNQKYSNKNWGGDSQRISSSSDWGTYAGTQNNFYYDNSSWGYPYYSSFYSPYYFGYYNSYFGYPRSSGWRLGFSWGMSPWSYNYNYYYNPYWNYNYWGYSPYYYNNYYYNPYYYNPYYRGYYDGYYYDNYYSPRHYRTPVKTYRRSDPDEIYRGNDNSYRGRTYTPNNGGFNRSNNQMNRPNNGFDRPSDWGNHNSDIERYQQQNSTPQRSSSSSSNGGNNSSSSGNGGFGRRSNW